MDKNMRATGQINVDVQGDRLVLTPTAGLVVVSTVEANGAVLWVWHPLSGWLIHGDMRRTDESGTEGRLEIGS